VFADLVAAVADGADCIDGVGQACGDREHVLGAAASTTTMWRLVDARSTPSICLGSAPPAPRPGPARGCRCRPGGWGMAALDIDATITIDHSDNKEKAAATWKKTWGHHSLLASWIARDRRRGGLGRAAAPGQRGQ